MRYFRNVFSNFIVSNKFFPDHRVMIGNSIGLNSLLVLLLLCGMGVFAVYAGCDPISLGIVSKKDQMLPLYVMQYLGFLKGVPGLFVACLFSGTLR